jgi:hypothetical protein
LVHSVSSGAGRASFASGGHATPGDALFSNRSADIFPCAPASKSSREQLTPLGTRPPYRYERVLLRRVASDALVAVGAARYSEPVEYVGLMVSVHESAERYEFFHQQRLVARHPKAARYSVVMEPEHYAGLLRIDHRKT